MGLQFSREPFLKKRKKSLPRLLCTSMYFRCLPYIKLLLVFFLVSCCYVIMYSICRQLSVNNNIVLMTGLTLLEGWMMEPQSALNSIELVLFFLFFLADSFWGRYAHFGGCRRRLLEAVRDAVHRSTCSRPVRNVGYKGQISECPTVAGISKFCSKSMFSLFRSLSTGWLGFQWDGTVQLFGTKGRHDKLKIFPWECLGQDTHQLGLIL